MGRVSIRGKIDRYAHVTEDSLHKAVVEFERNSLKMVSAAD